MLEVLQKRPEIDEAQTRFEQRLSEEGSEQGELEAGFQGGSMEVPYVWHEGLGFWAGFSPRDNRYWNAFGTEKPGAGTSEIAVEINPPLEGINRRMAGVFARDEDGTLYLLHRGNIGGSRPGIGKNNFLEWRSRHGHETRPVRDGDRTSEAIVITHLDSDRFSAHIYNFIENVEAFKEDITTGDYEPDRETDLTDELPETDAPSEFFGTYRIPAREATTAEADHGIIVQSLSELLDQRGADVKGNEVMDVFVPETTAGESWLFEVKTTTRPYDLYTAIGQLSYHGREFDRHVVVLPAEVGDPHLERLEELGLDVLLFEWNDQEPKFLELSAVFPEKM